MSKKKNDYKVLSNKRCVRCRTKLKQNLVDAYPDADHCYKCYQRYVKKVPSFQKVGSVTQKAYQTRKLEILDEIKHLENLLNDPKVMASGDYSKAELTADIQDAKDRLNKLKP